MTAATLISVEEYLSTTYRPDCEYIDGELLERNLGEYEHGDLQTEIGHYFRVRGREWNVRAIVELRIRVSSSRFRIPDVTVMWRDQTREPVLTQPPLICVEILSKNDSLGRMQDRIDDYLRFGVQNIWLIDPVRRRAWTCNQAGLTATELLTVPDTPIQLNLQDLFAELD